MWQSQVTEYFHSRKRNGNCQPSKRQKVVVETENSLARSDGTLKVSKAPGTNKTSSSAGQTTSTSSTSSKRKPRSRIPKLQIDTKVQSTRLNDIWSKSDTAHIADLSNDAALTKVHGDSSSSTVLQHQATTNKHKADSHNNVPDVAEDATNSVSGNKLRASPSKRHIDSEAEERETSILSDVVTAVVDDHGNSHPCTPTKRRTVRPDTACVAESSKRGRIIVPTDDSNYYKTPQKFDFSPYQLKTSTQRSSSARKKLVLSNAHVTETPSVYIFKGKGKKCHESLVIDAASEQSIIETQKEAELVVASSDKAEHRENNDNNTEVAEKDNTAVESAVLKTGNVKDDSKSRNASGVVKIGTCRNLEQLKKRLQELSPRKAKVSATTDDNLSASERYS